MQESKKALIVTGGTVSRSFLLKTACEHEFDIIAAVDNGLKALDEADIMPTHIIGDFDTADYKLKEKYMGMPLINAVVLHENKDLTDTQAAVELIISLNDSSYIVYILGALGGARPDHGLANIYILVHFLKAGINAYLLDETSCIFLINKDTILNKNTYNRKYISLLPLTWQVKGVTLNGMKYPLDKAVITIGDSIGISNEIIESKAEVLIEEGILIVISSNDASSDESIVLPTTN